METISKAKIKWVRSLQLKKTREEEQLFVVEGEKMVLEGLSCIPDELVFLVAGKDAVSLVPKLFAGHTHLASPSEMEQLSAFKTPNKLVAVFKRPVPQAASSGFQIALDGVQDPGNFGTILRLADWFGISSVVCSENTVDCYNPKVIQASMGAIFRISIAYVSLPDYFKKHAVPVYGALLDGSDYTQVNYAENGILLLGNEGSGISAALLKSITQPVTIPKYGQAESLNVATAAAILLAEVKR